MPTQWQAEPVSLDSPPVSTCGFPVDGVLLVGNLCHDVITLKTGERKHALGGSVAYIAGILEASGISIHVVSKVGGNFKYWDHLRGRIWGPTTVEHDSTTEFYADFSSSTYMNCLSNSISRARMLVATWHLYACILHHRLLWTYYSKLLCTAVSSDSGMH